MGDASGPSGHFGEGQIRLHPLVAKFMEAIESGEGVVELRGFIGPGKEDEDPVPLYASREMTECLLIPRGAIVHVRKPEPEQADDPPTRIYVNGSAELRLTGTIRADQASPMSWASKPIEGVGTSIPGWTGVSPAAECGDNLTWCIRAAGSDFQRQIECINNYVKCMEIARA